MPTSYDYIQTFYVNADSAQGSPQVLLTSVELYFKTKPVVQGPAPGVTVSICEVVANEPDTSRIVPKSIVYIPYDQINASSNSTDKTVFRFPNPISISTNKSYGIAIAFDSTGYTFWENVVGQRLMTNSGTVSNSISSGSLSNANGVLYKSTLNQNNSLSSNTFTPVLNRDLKFSVNVARFNLEQASRTINLVNRNFEFFSVTDWSSPFIGGEFVYPDVPNETGTITTRTDSKVIVGTGTQFLSQTLNRHIVFSSGGRTELLKIVNVISQTEIEVEAFPKFSASAISFKICPVGTVFFQDRISGVLYLDDSSASDINFKFSVGQTLVGTVSQSRATISSIDFKSVDRFTPRLNIKSPSDFNVSAQYKFANELGQMHSSFSQLNNDVLNEAENYDARIYSRSHEVSQPLDIFALGENKKSGHVRVNLQNVSGKQFSFTAPVVDGDGLDLFVVDNLINSSTEQTRTTLNGVSYGFDTETTKYGSGKTKHITRTISFSPDKVAEDLKVFLTAYRPAGTDIRVYAKLSNSLDKEPFDDKTWTKLSVVGQNEFSSQFDKNDYRELEFGIPAFPEHIDGALDALSFVSSNNSSQVTVSGGNATTFLRPNDVIKIYNPVSEANEFEVFVVREVGASQVTLNRPIVNNPNITGIVSARLLKYPTSAYINRRNNDVARYISSNFVEFDGFNTMQIKIVLLSNTTYLTPKVDSLQAIGVSA